jgi:hypothetical protein
MADLEVHRVVSAVISGHYSIWPITAALRCETAREHWPLILRPGRGHISIFVMRNTEQAHRPTPCLTAQSSKACLYRVVPSGKSGALCTEETEE